MPSDKPITTKWRLYTLNGLLHPIWPIYIGAWLLAVWADGGFR